ncbi:MAG: molybdenum cofactor guanylyltransferase [Terriglobia bacterium]
MPRRFQNVTGFVLAGGESRRMGRPKQGLVLGGQTMLQRQLRLLTQVCRETFIVGSQAAPHGGEVPALPDVFPGRGPLGGIYTGLARTCSEYNLVVSCDLPFLRSEFLEYLCHQAIRSSADVTVPQTADHGLQPLCAVYRRRMRRIIRASLDSGNGKISRVFPKVRCEILDGRELARKRFSQAIFVNMNTPAEYDAARRRIEGRYRF